MYPLQMFHWGTWDTVLEITTIVQLRCYQAMCQYLASVHPNVLPDITNILNMIVIELNIIFIFIVRGVSKHICYMSHGQSSLQHELEFGHLPSPDVLPQR